RVEQVGIKLVPLGHAANDARQDHAALPVGFGLPAALDLIGDAVHAIGETLRDFTEARRIDQRIGIESPNDGGLFDDRAAVAGIEALDLVDDVARLSNDIEQIIADMDAATLSGEARLVDAGVDEVILERPLILEILLGRAALDLIERRLGDIDVAAIDQLAHL